MGKDLKTTALSFQKSSRIRSSSRELNSWGIYNQNGQTILNRILHPFQRQLFAFLFIDFFLAVIERHFRHLFFAGAFGNFY